MLPRFKFSQLLCLVLLMCGLFIGSSNHAQAEEALASWYGPGFDGKTMANGDTYNSNGLTAASPTLPMGTELMVSYGGRSVPVTITDRGPYTGNRDLDLSQGAAKALGLLRPGVDYVDVECANGGVYPNCTAGSTAPQSAPAVQGVQSNTPVQSAAPVQNAAPVQEVTPLQDGATFQDGTTMQDGTGSGVHVVQPGETLSGIAAQLGTSVDQLAAQNGITDPGLIYAGQALFY